MRGFLLSGDELFGHKKQSKGENLPQGRREGSIGLS